MPKEPTEQIGYASFELEVPYKIIESGEKKEKPLIVYLHGYKQNMQYFQKKCEALLDIEAHHLFIQGPYPVYDEKHQREVAKWGRAWYLYDGEQEQFIRSLETTSGFLQKLIENVKENIAVTRVSVIGYSMGGYLAGYFGLSRPDLVDELIVMGGRIKTEHFKSNNYAKLNVLHLHGTKDQSVAAGRSKESCDQLESMGADVTYNEIEEGHRLTDLYFKSAKRWFAEKGYEVKDKRSAV